MVTLSPNAPLWAQEFAIAIQQELDTVRPIQMQSFADSSKLPDAKKYAACLVFKTDIAMTCFSDGTNWRRTDTGATV